VRIASSNADLEYSIMQWAATASKATRTPKAFIWLLLLHLAWRTKNTTFSFSNQMLRRYYRVSPQTKRRALEELEAAGQISIERHVVARRS
jgi:hypothetical protein